MHKLSLTKPLNEPILNFKTDDAVWKKFLQASEKVPKNFEVPMIIGGKKVTSAKTAIRHNPSTGEKLCTYQLATAEHGQLAVKAALAAKPGWSQLSPATRIQKLRDLEYVLENWRYEVCAITALECGYTANEIAASWAEMMDFVRFNSYFYTELLNEQMGDGHYETNQLHLRPLKGFTCAVTPFNFPIAIGYNLPLAMALTGNTVVWKPSHEAVLTSYMLMLALAEAGFPHGVVNFITGEGQDCLPPVLTHPELSCVNFTGSFATARIFGNYLYSESYPRQNFPRFVAETGGKDFLIADNDVDIADTAAQIVAGAFGRSGQKCSANSIAFIHQDIWSQLKPELIKQIEKQNVSNPLERSCDIGPVIGERAFQKITGYIERAKKHKDCEVLVGGTFSKDKGFFVSPTAILVNAAEHELLSEEVFGPVVAIKLYKDCSEIIKTLNLHNYRLTGSIVSRNEEFLEKAQKLFGDYAGNLYINRRTTGAIVNQQPFGGDGASGTNAKAGGKWYLLNFVSQGAITRRHSRTNLPSGFELIGS